MALRESNDKITEVATRVVLSTDCIIQFGDANEEKADTPLLNTSAP